MYKICIKPVSAALHASEGLKYSVTAFENLYAVEQFVVFSSTINALSAPFIPSHIHPMLPLYCSLPPSHPNSFPYTPFPLHLPSPRYTIFASIHPTPSPSKPLSVPLLHPSLLSLCTPFTSSPILPSSPYTSIPLSPYISPLHLHTVFIPSSSLRLPPYTPSSSSIAFIPTSHIHHIPLSSFHSLSSIHALRSLHTSLPLSMHTSPSVPRFRPPMSPSVRLQ